MALALLTWGPLLVLSAAEGLAAGGGVTVPFLASIGTHARFLVALPLFFVAEASVDPRLRHFVCQVVESRLVSPEGVSSLESAARSVSRRRDSAVAEGLLLGLTVAVVATGVRVDLPGGISSWRALDAGAGARLSLAGWWYAFVALPIFNFLLYRWCWRLLVWTAFLWRLARADLRLVPTHPDRAGGLGFLGVVQGRFGLLGLAASTVVAAIFAERLSFAGARLEAFTRPVLGIAVINVLLFLGPLLLFMPRLLAVKQRGLREYGTLATGYTQAFDAKWLRGSARGHEPILGTPDIQSLADLANSFDLVQRMRVVPFAPALVATLLAAALVPMLPLLLVAFPLEELLVGIVRLLLGV